MMTNALAVSVRLEKYPKTSIDVYVLVLQNDGGIIIIIFRYYMTCCISFINSLNPNRSAECGDLMRVHGAGGRRHRDGGPRGRL